MNDNMKEVLAVIQVILLVIILVYLIGIFDRLENPTWMRVLESWAG